MLRQASPLHDIARPVNQGCPIPINTSPPAVHICVACNIAFTNKSTLSRHQKQHCERKVEWVCGLCVPKKNFYRKDKLCQHHIDSHGAMCVPGCKQQWGGLCERHLNQATSELPPKKAWGCPCCLRCFDTFAAWTSHGGNHPVQNDKVVGWSLSMMVQSLMLQPYLKDAITHLPWEVCDPAKVKADVCQTLREALERHKLPDAVQIHYDYRHLQLPEALVQYAFCLVVYGVPYLEDNSVVAGEVMAKPTLEQSRTRFQGQHFSPSLQPGPSTPASGYWNPEDPFSYHQSTHQIARQDLVPKNPNGHLRDYPDNGFTDSKRSRANVQSSSCQMSTQAYDQVVHTSSAARSRDAELAPQGFGVCTSQEFTCTEKRSHGLSMKKSLQNLVHRPSSTKLTLSHTDPGLPVSLPSDSRTLEISRTAALLDQNKDSVRADPMEVLPISQRQSRLSGRMSDVQWDLFFTWPPEEHHDP